MKTSIAFAAGLGLCLSANLAHGTVVLDQQQPSTIHQHYTPFHTGQMLAQVVTPGVTGLLVEVRMPIRHCHPDATLVLTIQRVTDGKPDGTVLGSGSYAGTRFPIVGIAVDFSFDLLSLSPAVPVVAGTPIALVLTALPAGRSCGIDLGVNGDPYSGGGSFYTAGTDPTWRPMASDQDQPFQTYVDDGVGDLDGDGLTGDHDNCPAISNLGQQDTDGDGVGDICDLCVLDASNDVDDDGTCADQDNCPTTANPDQADNDGDTTGDACDDDDDDDLVPDATDNCPRVPNGDQADADQDGQGDACDGDNDNDGINDSDDLCADTPVSSVVDATGCAIAQLCPCDTGWKNHGAYVSCVAHAAEDFLAESLISELEKDAVVSAAAASSCGSRK